MLAYMDLNMFAYTSASVSLFACIMDSCLHANMHPCICMNAGVSLLVFVCLFCCFSPQSTAMVIVGRSDHLRNHTYFLGKLEQAVNQYFVHILSLVTDNNPY